MPGRPGKTPTENFRCTGFLRGLIPCSKWPTGQPESRRGPRRRGALAGRHPRDCEVRGRHSKAGRRDRLPVTGLAAAPPRARRPQPRRPTAATPARHPRPPARPRPPPARGAASRPHAPRHHLPLICSRRRRLVEGCLGAAEGFTLPISRAARFSRLKFLIARTTAAPISLQHDALRFTRHVGNPARATSGHIEHAQGRERDPAARWRAESGS